MTRQPVLIASDLDGTIVCGGREIPRRTEEALRRFVRNGGLFTVATGRAIGSACQFLDRLPVNLPMICLNGSVLYEPETDRVLESLPMDREEAAVLVETVYRRFPTLGMECFYERSVGIIRRTPFIKNSTIPEHHSFVDGREVQSFGPWHSLLFAGEPELLAQVASFVAEHAGRSLRFFFSSERYLELTNRAASKGEMLRVLARRLSLQMDCVYAAGDYDNDLELLLAAGHAAVPQNAKSALLHRAEKILSRCEDGALADLVEYLEQRAE